MAAQMTVTVDTVKALCAIAGDTYEAEGLIEPVADTITDPEEIAEQIGGGDTLRIVVLEGDLLGWGPFTHVVASEHESDLRYVWLAELETR